MSVRTPSARPLLLVIGLGLAPWLRAEPTVLPLWPEGAPGSKARMHEPEEAKDWWVRNIHHPSVTVFLPPPEKRCGTAVVICPGGGHRELVFDEEGTKPARFFNELGVAAFVLKYRLANEPGSPYTVEVHAAADVRRAMRLVRSRAGDWGLDPDRLGVMGWSAGGEVASFVAYGRNPGNPKAESPIERERAGADFQVIIYPGPVGLPNKLSKAAPPAFFLAANDDVTPSSVILSLVELYREVNRPIEVHLLGEGGHGFNMGDRSDLLAVRHWPDRLGDWLHDRGLLEPSAPR